MVWTLSAIPTSVSSWQIVYVRGTIIPQTFHTSISTTEQTREAVELFRDQQPAETTEWLQIGVSDQRGLTVAAFKDDLARLNPGVRELLIYTSDASQALQVGLAQQPMAGETLSKPLTEPANLGVTESRRLRIGSVTCPRRPNMNSRYSIALPFWQDESIGFIKTTIS